MTPSQPPSSPATASNTPSTNVRAAQCFATCLAGAQAQGNPVGFADCAIAAIAKSKGFMVATRNVRDFLGTGVEVINPWALTSNQDPISQGKLS
jgi:predicted nucleic acid-binding protein